MRPFGTFAAPVFACLLSVAQFQDARACGFDGVMGFGFSAMHPRSITVAMAIRQAVDDGLVGRSVIDPIVPGSAGYWRAVRRLIALQRTVVNARGDNSSGALPISVVFIDSDLWSRLNPVDLSYELQLHTKGAEQGDVVIVTSESILAAVLDGRIAIGEALARGLIAIDGSTGGSASTRQLLLVGLAPETISEAGGGSGKSIPVRLFGPGPGKLSQ